EAHARVERQRTCYDLPVPVPEDERRAELQRLVHVFHPRVAARRVGPEAPPRLVHRPPPLRAEGPEAGRPHPLSPRGSLALSCGLMASMTIAPISSPRGCRCPCPADRRACTAARRPAALPAAGRTSCTGT